MVRTWRKSLPPPLFCWSLRKDEPGICGFVATATMENDIRDVTSFDKTTSTRESGTSVHTPDFSNQQSVRGRELHMSPVVDQGIYTVYASIKNSYIVPVRFDPPLSGHRSFTPTLEGVGPGFDPRTRRAF